jgi:hypothetical protein
MQITRKQYDLLLGFYAHCYCVYHEKVKACFDFWAAQLDDANIPWSIQNNISVTAEDKGSNALYLSTHLKNKGVEIH